MNHPKKNKAEGLKLTPQRLAILDFLHGNTDHPSAEDIFCAVKEKYPSMSRATVYNTLEKLKKRGHILELIIDPCRKHYDPHTTPHHHVLCLNCGRIGDIHEEHIRLEISDRDIAGFNIDSWHINFEGVCNDCKPQNA